MPGKQRALSRWGRTRNYRRFVRRFDDVDCAIMRELQEQGDLPNVELARRVGLSPAATLRRVQQLRQNGVLTGVHAVVDHERVGLRVEAFVLVVLRAHTPEHDARFAGELARLPNVLRADAVTGADDVLLHVAAADTRELQEVLRTLPRIGASRVTTLLRLESVKQPSAVQVRPTDRR
jgi:Lrp/AsnC family transcriptional regulator, leucine-responsive regulatory protein